MAQFIPVAGIDLNALVADGHHPHYFVKKANEKYYELTKEMSLFCEKHPDETEQFEQDALNYTEHVDDNAFEAKESVKNHFQVFLQSLVPDSTVFACGSTSNGCGSDSSDLDLCWVIPYLATEDDGTKRLCYPTDMFMNFSPLHIFDEVRRLFELNKNIHNCSFIQARVPILKFEYRHGESVIDVDVNINNIVGVYNTLLLRFYSTIDVRVGQLCRILKVWGRKVNVINSYGKMLNSYAMCLMIIHFLQCGVNPPILPNLNALFPDLVNGNMPFSEVNAYLSGSNKFPTVEMSPKNTASLTSLIIDFLVYWGHFDYHNMGVFLRFGGVCPKKSFDSFFLEEVYDLTTVARNIRCASQDRLRQTFWSTLMNLKWKHFDFTSFINGEHAYYVGGPVANEIVSETGGREKKPHFFTGMVWNVEFSRLEEDSSGAEDDGDDKFVDLAA